MADLLENKMVHRRYNPLSGEWVLVCHKRNNRPWTGETAKQVEQERLAYDASCYLCPGNTRASGDINPEYESVYVFQNDYAALSPDTEIMGQQDPLFSWKSVQGTCRVICYTPHHSRTMAQMSLPEIEEVIQTWGAQIAELSKTYPWVQVFENKGLMMGCSNPHPHGQIWAQHELPTLIQQKENNQLNYYEEHGSSLLLDYAIAELEKNERVLIKTDSFICLVPYWAKWPFETMIIPTTELPCFASLTGNQKQDLAEVLQRIVIAYNKVFDCEFPYSMGWHAAPGDDPALKHWQLHAHFYPPLLRSKDIRKHMVGYEMLSESQRDFSPEQAVQILRGCL